jgi:EpsI family protein
MISSKSQFILLILCITSVILVKLITPTKKLSEIYPIVLDSMIPKTFDGWYLDSVRHDVIQSPEQEAVIKNTYSQVLARTYVNNTGDRVMLSIAYTDNQTDNAGKQSHKPEICYPAQGFSIVSAEPFILKTKFGILKVRKLLAATTDRVEPIIYWTTVGNIVANDNFSIKKAQVKNGFSGVLPDGIIFRVSMISQKNPVEYSSLIKYIDSLLSVLSQSDRKRISGLN